VSKRWQRYVPIIAGTVIVVIVAVLLIVFVRSMLASKKQNSTRQVAQVVKIIRPPPPQETPPPPPPPPEEKLEQPVEQPQQAPAQAAPAESLGLDADASAGGDSFGLAARPGGHDLVGNGTAPFRWYTDLIANRIQECLSEDERIRKGSYKAGVKVRVNADGDLEIAELVGSSGSRDKDEAIRGMKKCTTGQGKPIEMPQLVSIQIVSRG
jgi:protein TonB